MYIGSISISLRGNYVKAVLKPYNALSYFALNVLILDISLSLSIPLSIVFPLSRH